MGGTGVAVDGVLDFLSFFVGLGGSECFKFMNVIAYTTRIESGNAPTVAEDAVVVIAGEVLVSAIVTALSMVRVVGNSVTPDDAVVDGARMQINR